MTNENPDRDDIRDILQAAFAKPAVLRALADLIPVMLACDVVAYVEKQDDGVASMAATCAGKDGALLAKGAVAGSEVVVEGARVAREWETSPSFKQDIVRDSAAGVTGAAAGVELVSRAAIAFRDVADRLAKAEAEMLAEIETARAGAK